MKAHPGLVWLAAWAVTLATNDAAQLLPPTLDLGKLCVWTIAVIAVVCATRWCFAEMELAARDAQYEADHAARQPERQA